MKALGIVGSPRKGGNCEILTAHALKAIAEEGLETELIGLAGLDIRPCTACGACSGNETCSIDDDLLPVYRKMKEADAIIIAAPVYMGSLAGLAKCFMERAGYIDRNNKRVFEGKVGGPIVVARRAGQNFTLAQMMFWFQLCGFLTPGSNYWNMAIGRAKGDVVNDEEGMRTAWNFGKNVAALLKRLNK
jgi:multimeric flavodoxin WrbA